MRGAAHGRKRDESVHQGFEVNAGVTFTDSICAGRATTQWSQLVAAAVLDNEKARDESTSPADQPDGT